MKFRLMFTAAVCLVSAVLIAQEPPVGPGAGAPGRADGVLLHVDHEGRRPGRRDHELRRRERPVLGDVHQASEAGGGGRGPPPGGHRHHQPRS